MEACLKALVEPRRIEILKLVGRRELPAGMIASHFRVTRPAISQHLRVLTAAGLLTERRQGTRRLYRVRPDGFQELRRFLEGFWDLRLDQLKRAVEREKRKRAGHARRRSTRTPSRDLPSR